MAGTGGGGVGRSGMVNPAFRQILTLAFIEKGEEILLGFKKRGFGQGLWNGFGGKVEKGETVPEAAAREIKEECGLEVGVRDLKLVGIIHFLFCDNPTTILELHVFRCGTFTGEVQESEEMAPKWWSKDQIPFSQMWSDDEMWWPHFTEKISFRALFVYEGYNTKILAYQINSMDDRGRGGKEEEGLLLQEEKNPNFNVQELWPRIKSLPLMSITPRNDQLPV